MTVTPAEHFTYLMDFDEDKEYDFLIKGYSEDEKLLAMALILHEKVKLAREVGTSLKILDHDIEEVLIIYRHECNKTYFKDNIQAVERILGEENLGKRNFLVRNVNGQFTLRKHWNTT